MSFIDISIRGHVGTFTKRAKPHGLTVQIFLKVPRADLTTVRILGSRDNLEPFIEQHFADQPLAIEMHKAAIKDGFKPVVAPKNRALMENRV